MIPVEFDDQEPVSKVGRRGHIAQSLEPQATTWRPQSSPSRSHRNDVPSGAIADASPRSLTLRSAHVCSSSVVKWGLACRTVHGLSKDDYVFATGGAVQILWTSWLALVDLR